MDDVVKSPHVVSPDRSEVVEIRHLTPEFVKYLDNLIGIVDQAGGYADIVLQRRKKTMQQVNISTSHRQGYNY